METGHRNFATAQPGAMDRGVRRLQDHPSISRTECRDDTRRIQDDLLVGMEPSAAWARDRRRLSAALSLVPLARRLERGCEAPVVADLRPRRAAGRGRLVDGGFGPVAAGRGFAVSARYPSGAGDAPFCGRRLGAVLGGDTARAPGGFLW